MQHMQQARCRPTGAALKTQILGTKKGEVAAQEQANLKFSIEFYRKC